MEPTLKKTIEDALRAACAPALAEVLLEDSGNGHVGGQVVSSRFDGMKPSERQDLIWAHLDAHLTRHDATRISFIVADTPAERAGLADSHAG
jgi:acid stress-induced BolA-like protein IbaG/YrbA